MCLKKVKFSRVDQYMGVNQRLGVAPNDWKTPLIYFLTFCVLLLFFLFSLHRPEETSMRPRPMLTGAW